MALMCRSERAHPAKEKERRKMYAKLIIDGNAVYEIDEACLLRQNQDKKKRGGKNRDRKNPGSTGPWPAETMGE